MLLRLTAERAAVGMKADHVEAADQTNILFSFHLTSFNFQKSRAAKQRPLE
jgi:hypothetical protein